MTEERKKLEGKIRMLGFMIAEYDKLIKSLEKSRSKLRVERYNAKKQLEVLVKNEKKCPPDQH